jgi:hypothetical protein
VGRGGGGRARHSSAAGRLAYIQTRHPQAVTVKGTGVITYCSKCGARQKCAAVSNELSSATSWKLTF